MMVRVLWWVCVGCIAVDLAALMAHVLELPNKLGLPGPLWLAVQQHLYRGWGPVLGPFEVGAVVTSWALALGVRGRPGAGRAFAAAGCLTLSLALFFLVVQPVNVAVAEWTAVTLPPDWPRWRLRWEVGHAVRAALTVAALALVLSVPRPVGPSREPSTRRPPETPRHAA